MDGAEPAGGRWNFDEQQNRQPPPEHGLDVPGPVGFSEDEIDEQVRRDLNRWQDVGEVQLTGDDGPGEFAVTRTEAGNAVGEFAAVDQLPRSATVTTCGAVAAQVIKSDDFVDCIRRDPDISHAVSKSVIAKMRVASARRIDLSGSDVPARVARVLVQLALTYGSADRDEVVKAPLTQPELASLAAASPPAVHRVLRDLRELGIVSTGYRTIAVLDLDRLQKAAYP
jgi:CRP/FNR family cyclic AMP-dependent transcriptional regulator